MIENLHGTRETITYDEKLLIKPCYNYVDEDYPLHWQPSYEVIMPLDSDYVVFIQDTELMLKPGDILFIAPGILHRIPAPGEGARYILLFNPTLFTSISELEHLHSMFAPYMLFTSAETGRIREMNHLLHDIYNEYAGDEPLKYGAIYARLLELVIAARRSLRDGISQPVSEGINTFNKHHNDFLAICRYIETNCAESIALPQLADMYGFSESHFIRLFRQFTGIPFYSYLNHCRVNRAKQLLAAEPDCSITEIYQLAGFSSIATFNRLFKKQVGCSPSQYRSYQSM